MANSGALNNIINNDNKMNINEKKSNNDGFGYQSSSLFMSKYNEKKINKYNAKKSLLSHNISVGVKIATTSQGIFI